MVRMAGSFRIPVEALRGATTARTSAASRCESLLVVRWEHGEQQWRTGFRMDASKNIKSGASGAGAGPVGTHDLEDGSRAIAGNTGEDK